MPIDKDTIKQALDSFEADDFIAAKDALKQQISGAVYDYYKDKLEQQKDLGSTTEPESNGETETEADNETGTETNDED